MTRSGSATATDADADTAPSVGARVVDRDDDDPDEAVVVNRPDATADEWEVTHTRTVATFPGNEAYADEAPVAVVVFRDVLDEARPGYAGDAPLPVADLAAEGVNHYAFPEPRLRVIGHLSVDTDDEAEPTPRPEPSSALVALSERLVEGGGASVAWELDATGDEPLAVLVVTKLGETYRVRPDGTVEGDGAVADRLTALAADYVTQVADGGGASR